MNEKKEYNDMIYSSFDHWILNALHDPFTSYLDYCMFPIHSYENEKEYIIEAFLLNTHSRNICISCENNEICIQIKNDPLLRKRSIILPNYIGNKTITSTFDNEILQISIKK